jgi:hypothetical protein
MPKPASATAEERLAEGFDLDRLWGSTMRMPEGDTKEQPLRLLMTVLEVEQVPYAVIGGLAVQLYTEEPRTTKDIDVALASYTDLPAPALERAGFEHERRFAHSDNWRAPGPGPRRTRTPIQFTVDTLTPPTVARAEVFQVLGGNLRVARLQDLLLLKLEAAGEPARRASKRRSDAADISRLLEEHPELEREVPDVRARLARIDDLIRGE